MIVVDTSAILAIIWKEADGSRFLDAMVDADGVLISAATRLEAWTVCRNRRGVDNAQGMERFLSGLGVVTIPFDEHQFLFARDAYERFGKGRNGLNFGDCFSYALAKARDLPLLYKGEDFGRTDIMAAV